MDKGLSPSDVTGGTFWLLSIAMVGAAFFFFIERSKIDAKWQTPVTMVGVVMTISAVQYYYLKEMWFSTGHASTVLRYIDWALSRPLQVVTFYALIAAVATISEALFWRLLIGALVTVVGEFLGAAGFMSPTLGFLVGMVGWLYVLGELYLGEASSASQASNNEALEAGFLALRLIVTIGWAIYPLGYFMQYLGGGVDTNLMNTVYNLIEFLNKIIFGVIVYRIAIANSHASRTKKIGTAAEGGDSPRAAFGADYRRE